MAKQRVIFTCERDPRVRFLPDDKNHKMADIQKDGPFEASSFSVFLGHVYLQHAWAEFLAHHNLNYNLYLISHDARILDSNAFALLWNLGIAKAGKGNSLVKRNVLLLIIR